MEKKNLLNRITDVIDRNREIKAGGWPNLLDWRAELFKTTWRIIEWNNVNGNESSLSNQPFQDTKLAKGLFGKLLSGLGYSWEMNGVSEETLASEGIYCSKLPYSPIKKSIMLHTDKKTLEELFKQDIKKFRCTYHYEST